MSIMTKKPQTTTYKIRYTKYDIRNKSVANLVLSLASCVFSICHLHIKTGLGVGGRGNAIKPSPDDCSIYFYSILLKNVKQKIPTFDIRYSLFDIRYSLFDIRYSLFDILYLPSPLIPLLSCYQLPCYQITCSPDLPHPLRPQRSPR